MIPWPKKGLINVWAGLPTTRWRHTNIALRNEYLELSTNQNCPYDLLKRKIVDISGEKWKKTYIHRTGSRGAEPTILESGKLGVEAEKGTCAPKDGFCSDFLIKCFRNCWWKGPLPLNQSMEKVETECKCGIASINYNWRWSDIASWPHKSYIQTWYKIEYKRVLVYWLL